ncbi:MAG: hypothetical protein EAZ97_14115 [Bacteroidetes bacterium]|nr:MAG: hypothetical protein EAZ97_14115 [Bacteroidota bacterium]
MSNIATAIIDGVKKAQQEQITYQKVFESSENIVAKNEFLFFLKPELTVADPKIKFSQIVELALAKINEFGLKIKNISVLSAQYLQNYNIIAQHYGVINQLSSNPKQYLSEGARAKFQELYGKTVAEANLLGSVEFLTKYPAFNALSLDYLWQNKANQKLAGGTYCEDIKLDGDLAYVINGFHPRQLMHFTDKGRSIVVFTLAGDLKWSEARTNLIGTTNPQTAASGSLRKSLLDKKDELGLAEVSQGMNGVHLSAGAVEGLVELIRYNSNFASKELKTFTDFSFGKSLKSNFSDAQIDSILNNENVNVDGKNISIFDLTEEKDSDEAIAILKNCFKI